MIRTRNKRVSKDDVPAVRKRILIADTAPNVLAHLGGAFESANFDVITATNAQECLDLFRKEDMLDMVLLNGHIPGEEAIGVIINIRKSKPNQMILVAVEEENTRAKAMRHGADVAVIKPITAQAVVSRVNSLLAQDESFKVRHRAQLEQSRTK